MGSTGFDVESESRKCVPGFVRSARQKDVTNIAANDNSYAPVAMAA